MSECPNNALANSVRNLSEPESDRVNLIYQENLNYSKQVESLNKEISRKDAIILQLWEHVLETNDKEFIAKVTAGVASIAEL